MESDWTQTVFAQDVAEVSAYVIWINKIPHIIYTDVLQIFFTIASTALLALLFLTGFRCNQCGFNRRYQRQCTEAGIVLCPFFGDISTAFPSTLTHSNVCEMVISLDYYLAYFLLYQTYEMNKETGCYTSDDRYFLKIPEQDLLQTAELYLGLSNFSISDISAWPFAAPENGICYFTKETSSITNITVDKETGEILVFADLYDSQYEDSTQEKTSLIYHFSVISAANGKTVYRLESITVQ